MGASFWTALLTMGLLGVSAMDVTLVALVLAAAALGMPRLRILSLAWVMPLVVALLGTVLSTVLATWWGAPAPAAPTATLATPLAPFTHAPWWVVLVQLLIGLALLVGAVAAWLGAARAQTLVASARSAASGETVAPLISKATSLLQRFPGAGLLAGAGLALTSMLDAPFFGAVVTALTLPPHFPTQLPLWLVYALVAHLPVLVAATFIWGRGERGATAVAGAAQRSAARVLRVTAVSGALVGVVLIAQAALAWLA
ncbi:MAG: hypothetical protein Q4P06_08895 [Actinomycetaceae bacterium]|nr:hypothetical protein [Actinomycetaceae bacterium]